MMSSPLCLSENVGDIERALKTKKLFSKNLEESTLLMIFEILWNIKKQKSKCKECFSKKTLKSLKKHKQILKRLLTSNKTVEKRHKIFLKSTSSFKKLIKKILKEFLKNCLEKVPKTQ